MRTKDFIDYLIGQGYNVFPDPNFIPGDIPESQLPALFVFGTGGYGPHDHLPIDNPTLQVIVKGKSYKVDATQMDQTEQLSKQLINTLDKKTKITVGTTLVYVCHAVQSNPIPIGIDEHDRPTFSTNFRFEVRR